MNNSEQTINQRIAEGTNKVDTQPQEKMWGKHEIYAYARTNIDKINSYIHGLSHSKKPYTTYGLVRNIHNMDKRENRFKYIANEMDNFPKKYKNLKVIPRFAKSRDFVNNLIGANMNSKTSKDVVPQFNKSQKIAKSLLHRRLTHQIPHPKHSKDIWNANQISNYLANQAALTHNVQKQKDLYTVAQQTHLEGNRIGSLYPSVAYKNGVKNGNFVKEYLKYDHERMHRAMHQKKYNTYEEQDKANINFEKNAKTKIFEHSKYAKPIRNVLRDVKPKRYYGYHHYKYYHKPSYRKHTYRRSYSYSKYNKRNMYRQSRWNHNFER